MTEIRYRRILFFQAIFLIVLALITFILFKENSKPIQFLIVWIAAIILNLIYVKRYALPTRSLLRKIRSSAIDEDLSWAEIEESIIRKDVAFNKQKEAFELENLKYKRLLDSLEDPVCILNKNLLIIYVNQAFGALFDFADQKLPFPLIEITRNLEFQEFLKSSIGQERTSRRSYFTFNQLQDPHKTFFDLKVFPVDNLSNYLCLLHDVTERKMADQMREDFVSNFSHEVRTPLTILNGQMQNLKEALLKEDNFESRFAQYFVKIDNNTRRLINLFNDLLRLSSVESKKDIIKESVNIEEMLTYLTQDLLTNYPNKKILFDILLDQKVFFVDYHLFEQVLLNLIDNSLKYIEHNGVITIRSHHEDGWDHLVIKDNGVGIPEDQINRIFERFFRVDSSRSSEIEGTGLGLSIVKHIIQKHDGRIKVQSKLLEGTSFTLSFPCN
ncbi:MAG: ATP-binding protein [Bacteriovorax sp.]|nr:ATP-binding protein [Bacteriovorax sp.]